MWAGLPFFSATSPCEGSVKWGTAISSSVSAQQALLALVVRAIPGVVSKESIMTLLIARDPIQRRRQCEAVRSLNTLPLMVGESSSVRQTSMNLEGPYTS
jgi:hypothetical protein